MTPPLQTHLEDLKLNSLTKNSKYDGHLEIIVKERGLFDLVEQIILMIFYILVINIHRGIRLFIHNVVCSPGIVSSQIEHPDWLALG